MRRKNLVAAPQVFTTLPPDVIRWYQDTAGSYGQTESWLYRLAAATFVDYMKDTKIVEPIPEWNRLKGGKKKISFWPGPTLTKEVAKIATLIGLTAWSLWRYILVWYWKKEH